MTKYLVAASLAALFAAPAFAADDPMAGFYGNTIVSKGGSATLRTHYRADHTFDFTGSMVFLSKTFRGTWALDGKGKLCRTYIGDPPPDTPNPSCIPCVPRKIGDDEIVHRLVYALVNEGARILEEGIAQRAGDIDMVYLTGYGFPMFRGGPMNYADTQGLFNVVQAMKRFAANPHDDAAFWKRAPLLARLAAEGKSFN